MEHERTPETAPVPDRASLTDVESWLLDMGLRAMQVERCPAPDCGVCAGTSTTSTTDRRAA